jgi:hypothetical protein
VQNDENQGGQAMTTIDQIADDHDKLKAKLKKANSKLRQAKLRMDALAVERDRALQTVDRANAANIRARAMICDAAGIPHDADILEWISRAKERIARMEKVLSELVAMRNEHDELQEFGNSDCAYLAFVKGQTPKWDEARNVLEAKP